VRAQLFVDIRREGRDIASRQPRKADELQAVLLGYLKSVNAETTRSVPRKKPGGDDP
jgi:hypothetical protein